MGADWGVNSLRKSEESCTWFSEYKRLHGISSKGTLKPWATLSVHEDEVLNVAMSHCGNYISTSSKDKSVIIWVISEFSTKSVSMFKRIPLPTWASVFQSTFNKDDSFLMVSGIMHEESVGKVKIFSFPKCKHMKTVDCVPYDCFGSWLGSRFFLVGDFDYGSVSANVIMHSVYDVVPPKTVYSDPNSNPRYPFHCRRFETCDLKNNRNVKLLFYACSQTTQFAHALAVAVFSGIKKRKLEFERDGILPFHISDDDDDDDNYPKSNSLRKNHPVDSEPSDYCGTFKNAVNLKAAIIGINANENLEKLFVNCRPWISEDNPSEISMNIETRIFDFDLNLLQQVSKGEAVTPSNTFFLIHISSSSLYTASGDEKGKIHIFDSNYNIHLCTLMGHQDVVNCATTSPTDPHFVCSVSDDHSIKFWDLSSVKK